VDAKGQAGAESADELVPVPSSGRVFEDHLRVGPADVTPADRAGLDRIASWLQDIAYHDVVDGGLEGAGFWIVRRTRIRVERFPRFTENLRLRTFCGGASRALAERRTSIDGDAGAAIETVSVWVNVDPESHLPARLPEEFMAAYAPFSPRKPRSRLRHPPPPDDAVSEPWAFRPDDLDIVGHVNNARYWAIVDDRLVAPRPEQPVDIEVEHRAPAQPGEARVLSANGALWVAPVDSDGEVFASAVALGPA
jgi:acyl-ACP thioesterase